MDNFFMASFTHRELNWAYKFVISCFPGAGLTIVTEKNPDFTSISILGLHIGMYYSVSPKDFYLSEKSKDT